MDVGKVEKSVNSLTPDTVFIRRLEQCENDFHARYSAEFRYYTYTISLKSTALYHDLVWTVNYRLSPELLAAELDQVKGRHDFRAFSIPRNDGKSTECQISRAELEVRNSLFIIHMQADRFLHKMVRSIVGACYDVSRKYHSPGLIKSIFEKKFEGEHTWAQSSGLCLKKVGYSDYEY
jgi:tRNA pseudouridine38-40 synthase